MVKVIVEYTAHIDQYLNDIETYEGMRSESCELSIEINETEWNGANIGFTPFMNFLDSFKKRVKDIEDCYLGNSSFDEDDDEDIAIEIDRILFEDRVYKRDVDTNRFKLKMLPTLMTDEEVELGEAL